MIKFFRFFSIVMLIAWAVVIFRFSSQSADDSGSLSHNFTHRILCIIYPGFNDMPLMEQLDLRHKADKVVRKIAHFTVFAVFGFIACAVAFAYMLKKPLRQAAPAVTGLVYAVSDEIHQLFVPGRSCEFTDVLIDFAGCLLGICITRLSAGAFLSARKR